VPGERPRSVQAVLQHASISYHVWPGKPTSPRTLPPQAFSSAVDGRRLLSPLGQGGDHRDGDTLTVLDVLAEQVGIRGMFSDWPATTTFYASCMGMK